jgi:hypothetical protein
MKKSEAKNSAHCTFNGKYHKHDFQLLAAVQPLLQQLMLPTLPCFHHSAIMAHPPPSSSLSWKDDGQGNTLAYGLCGRGVTVVQIDPSVLLMVP